MFRHQITIFRLVPLNRHLRLILEEPYPRRTRTRLFPSTPDGYSKRRVIMILKTFSQIIKIAVIAVET